MNNSTLYEYTISPKNEKKQYTFYIVFKIIKILFIVLAILTAIYAFYVSNFMWLVVLLFFVIAFLFGRIQRRFYNFYDCSFCYDEIKFAKIVNNKKRWPIIKFNVKDIVKIGFITSKDFNRFEIGENYKKIYAKGKPLDITNVYIAITNNNENKLIITSYNSKLLNSIINKTSNSILDGEFVETLKSYEKYNLSW